MLFLSAQGEIKKSPDFSGIKNPGLISGNPDDC